MISAVMIMNQRGDVIIYRVYRDDVTRDATQAFRMNVIARKETGTMPPVLYIDKSSYLYTRVNDLFFVCVTRSNVNPALGFSFIYSMLGVFKAFFDGDLNESKVRNNFTLIYELLDETMDFGYPQNSSVDVLQLYIMTSDKKLSLKDAKLDNSQITSQITGAVDWRKRDLRYKKNEVFIDVLENVNLLMSADGNVLRNDVTGRVLMKTYLTGMPECKFGLNDKVVMDKSSGSGSGSGGDPKTKRGPKAVEIDDCTFHRCVRLGKFDADRTITFIPPDGEFDLMTYRITENVQLPFRIIPIVEERGGTSAIFNIKAISNFSKDLIATNIVFKIPVPPNTARCKVRVTSGSAKYEPESSAIMWRMRSFPGKHEYAMHATADLMASMKGKKWARPPISLEFHVPMFTASGLVVRFLKVFEKTAYQTTKWVRYVTRAGNYQIRI